MATTQIYYLISACLAALIALTTVVPALADAPPAPVHIVEEQN